ncbi:MAG: hypothetical protein WA828_04325 [Coleofasciculaceae cyanobacterium]
MELSLNRQSPSFKERQLVWEPENRLKVRCLMPTTTTKSTTFLFNPEYQSWHLL